MSLYTPEFEMQIKHWAQERVKAKRWSHVEGVVDTVERLARRYAPDTVMQARLAGWLHDAAKHLSNAKLIHIAEAHGWPISESEHLVPDLLHGVVGYLLADDVFNLADEQLKTACAYHTTGAPDMTMLDKIVMIGDLIEPGRKYDDVERLRRVAAVDLDAAVLLSVDVTLRYLIRRGRIIDPRPVYLRNQLLVAGVSYDGL